MMPAIHLFTTLTSSELFNRFMSIVNSHHNRLTDLEGLIGNRLDDQFDSDDYESAPDSGDDFSPEN